MQDNILELKNIGKTFSGVNVLRNINFSIRRGEVHALLGENGAGKSTLIKIISGYHLPDKGGEIYVDGKPVVFRCPKDSKDAAIHTIYQELVLCKDMTVAENIVIDKQDQFKGIRLKEKEFIRIAKDVLKRLDVAIDPNTLVRNLSIAQQQVVEIAKALTANAKVILMDEPTSSISQKDSDKLLEIIKKLRDDGVTIIYISHRMHEIYQIADRITVLRDGNYIGTVDCKGTSEQEIISMMVGREIEDIFPKRDVEPGDVVLKVESLSSDTFSNVSFEVRKGEILGIGGLVGSKRTDVLEAIFGIRPITGGKIYLNGKPYQPKEPKDSIENGIAFITEDRKKTGLVLCLPAMENLNMVNAEKKAKWGYLNWKMLHGIAEKYRKSLNIALANLSQITASLSGGNQQKVVLGKWLEFGPQLILFDEPTRGIDIGAKTEIYNIMGDLVQNGASIIMVSSELPELISISDRIVVMCEGRVTGTCSREEATQELIMNMAAFQKLDTGRSKE